MWRICENNAKVTIVGPYYTSLRAWQDPMRARVLSEATWAYFNKEWREREKFGQYPIACDFSVDKVVVFFESAIGIKNRRRRGSSRRSMERRLGRLRGAESDQMR